MSIFETGSSHGWPQSLFARGIEGARPAAVKPRTRLDGTPAKPGFRRSRKRAQIPQLKIPVNGDKPLIGMVLLLASLFLLVPADSYAYIIKYKEEYYQLYHLHYVQYPDDTMENIYWLEQALKADFANPLYALALIENEAQWEKYRYLFTMHTYLKLIEQWLFLGNKWNKRNAYFYNAPWKEQNLESLETAEACFKAALSYWDSAKEWAEKVYGDKRFRFVNLQRIQYWEDEAWRIQNGKLNYGRTIERELKLLQNVREKFEAMDENTY